MPSSVPALVLLIGLGVGGYALYQKIQQDAHDRFIAARNALPIQVLEAPPRLNTEVMAEYYPPIEEVHQEVIPVKQPIFGSPYTTRQILGSSAFQSSRLRY
jgi:hypothetical protein